jgi:CheY-like chemotaxis protein
MTKIPPKSLVLYADDDPDDLTLVSEAFSKYSSHVELVTVQNGAEAIDFLGGLTPDDPMPCLIILDVNMPRLNGKEALTQLRKMQGFEDIPVILFTTSSLAFDKTFATKHGAGFVSKPLNSRQMGIIIDQFVDHCAEEVRKQIRNGNNK